MVLVGLEMVQVLDQALVMGLVVGQVVEVPLAMETAKVSLAKALLAKALLAKALTAKVPLATARAVGGLLEHGSSSKSRYKRI